MDTRTTMLAAMILGGAYIVGSFYASGRFELSPSPSGTYRLDRQTGEVWYCNPAACIAVPLAVRVPQRGPAAAAPAAQPPAQPAAQGSI